MVSLKVLTHECSKSTEYNVNIKQNKTKQSIIYIPEI